MLYFPILSIISILHYCSELPSSIDTKLQIRSDRTVRFLDFQQTDFNDFNGVGTSTSCFCLNYHNFPTYVSFLSTFKATATTTTTTTFGIQWIFALLICTCTIFSPYSTDELSRYLLCLSVLVLVHVLYITISIDSTHQYCMAKILYKYYYTS